MPEMEKAGLALVLMVAFLLLLGGTAAPPG